MAPADATAANSTANTDISGAAPPTEVKAPRKFHNGWNRQLESLVASWADKAACYQWMHQKTAIRFSRRNMYFTIPVIIMSTLTGTANFATESIVGGSDSQKYVTFGIGAISLIAGIISTVANFLRYAQESEAHRVAAISWGKFQRFISIELSLHPNERMDAMSFLKMGRIELDRLIEQSPSIPERTIGEFLEAFKNKTDIIKPEIAGGIEHTRIFEDKESRLAKVAAEAAYIIQQKKGLMRQIVLEDIDKRIVQRTRDERADMEEVLRAEIRAAAREVARETTIATLQRPPKAAMPAANIAFPTSRHEVNAVVPVGAVEKAKEKILRRASVHATGLTVDTGVVRRPSTTGRIPFIPSLLNQTLHAAAAQAAAARASSGFPTPSSPSREEGPTSVSIEIVEDDAPPANGK